MDKSLLEEKALTLESKIYELNSIIWDMKNSKSICISTDICNVKIHQSDIGYATLRNSILSMLQKYETELEYTKSILSGEETI